MLEQKYVQETIRIYNINKWSYVQVVSKRSFYENELTEVTKIAVRNRGWKMLLDIKNLEFSDITDSYYNVAKTHQ